MPATFSISALLFCSQYIPARGLRADLFKRFSEQTERASDLSDFDVAQLCLENPGGRLQDTRYLQPALFVINTLHYQEAIERDEPKADIVLGHSLGEYNALLAAGAFDFDTALRLVAKREELMSKAPLRGILVVKDMHQEALRFWLEAHELQELNIANDNNPVQTSPKLSGPLELIKLASQLFEQENIQTVRLNVPFAFHSRLMRSARDEMAELPQKIHFSPLHIPVIANFTGRPYLNSDIVLTLAGQIIGTVRWTNSIRYLQHRSCRQYYREVGGSKTLLRMIRKIEIAKPNTPSISASRERVKHIAHRQWQNSGTTHAARPDSADGPIWLVLLSALSLNVLRAYAAQWLSTLEHGEYQESDLPRIAYTSQVGRIAMTYRLGLAVGSLNQLGDGLKAWLAGDVCEYIVAGHDQYCEAANEPFEQEALFKGHRYPLDLRSGLQLLDLWIQGMIFDWRHLYELDCPPRILLPSYPYQLDYHPACEQDGGRKYFLYPLPHDSNTTYSLKELRFSSYCTGDELFIADNLFQGVPQLPGLAYLEIASAVAMQVGLQPSGLSLLHNTWLKPLYVCKPCQVHVALSVQPSGTMTYEIYGDDQQGVRQSHLRGYMESSQTPISERLDLQLLHDYCSGRTIDAGKCYEHFEQVGMEYGKSLQVINRIEYGEGLAMVRFEVTSKMTGNTDSYLLHPGVLESTLQSTFGLFQVGFGRTDSAVAPVALEEIQILRATPLRGWVVSNFTIDDCCGADRRMEIDICDDYGEVCVRLRGFSVCTILIEQRLFSTSHELSGLKKSEEALN